MGNGGSGVDCPHRPAPAHGTHAIHKVVPPHSGSELGRALTASSIDDFRNAVGRLSSIPAPCIICLTPQGKHLKSHMPLSDEVYVYDSRIGQAASSASSPYAKTEVALPKRYTAPRPPNSIDDFGSLETWQELFGTRRTWALQLVEECRKMVGMTQERYGEMEAMLRCLDAAIANLESVSKGIESKYTDLKGWTSELQSDFGKLATGWEQYLSLAGSIPVSPDMVCFMTGRDVLTAKGRRQKKATLEDLVDLDTACKLGRQALVVLRKRKLRIMDLESSASRLSKDASQVSHDFRQTMSQSTLSHDSGTNTLLQDIEAVAKKMDTDLQTVLVYSKSTPGATVQASKIAATHTERFLPSLRSRALKIDEMLRYVSGARNKLARESADFMRRITDTTALSNSVKSQMQALNPDDEIAMMDYLRLIQKLPYIYVSFVAEAVRRREWFEKMKLDSATLANEMALFQDEESKRRKRWQKSIGSAYGSDDTTADAKVPGLEVNLLGEDEQWPAMSRIDLDEFHALVQRVRADADIVTGIAKMIADLSSPTRQQTKRLKAFRNGSVHEAALGRSGLLIRGDDDLVRTLQDDKTKVESKLRTAESRVRRLEDLLHRQAQACRPSLGAIFQSANPQQVIEHNDSAADAEDQRPINGTYTLLQQVQQLEAELDAEKERSTGLEKELKFRTVLQEEMHRRMDEVNSTKTDLLENMEALKREFMVERKSLHDEVERLQVRLEDTEDEMEHMGESRDNEKAAYEERVRTLEVEMDNMTEGRHDEMVRLGEEVNLVQKENSVLRTQSDRWKSTVEVLTQALRGVWERSSPEMAVPEDAGEMMEGVAARVGQLEEAVLQLTAETRSARESLAEEQLRSTALRRDLDESRLQLAHVRRRLTETDSGSESTRKKLEEEEVKKKVLAKELASRQLQAGRLEEEVRRFQERLLDCQSKLAQAQQRLDGRGERAKQLTQRLGVQTDGLVELLDRLGFSMRRQGGGMVMQKVSRSERLAQNSGNADAGLTLRRSGFPQNRPGAEDEQERQQDWQQDWMNSPDGEVESERYDAFVAGLSSFDTEAFCEAVYRRVKEVEHVARKLQRESRNQREEVHRLQKEAHDKIAFRHFKEGDLVLFLPTRNQSTGAWAAFNVGFPHYFLREQECHRLRSREWLVARITRVQERVVDLGKSLQAASRPCKRDGASEKGERADTDSTAGDDNDNDNDNDNPFDLSDGLRWYLMDALEDKAGAPSTPGLAKSTVAANTVEAMADIHTHARPATRSSALSLVGRTAPSGLEGLSKSLSKSLESRRSSTGSRKTAGPLGVGRGRESAAASETNSIRAVPADTPVAASPTMPMHAAQPVEE